MADSVDRVFGHALNTVNKIRPGSQKPPASDRLALYGLYKQSMEGDVTNIAEEPSVTSQPNLPIAQLEKEREKWVAWKQNEGLSRTEAKRRYIEKLIETMHKYASGTEEAKQLVEELEFVWDQIKNNSQHSSSEHSSPLQALERSGYIQTSSSGNGIASDAAALENAGTGRDRGELRVLSPVSQAEEDEVLDEEREEFVDAPVSQVDDGDLHDPSGEDAGVQTDDALGALQRTGEASQARRPQLQVADGRWRKRIESSLMRLTTEVAALREQLEARQWIKTQRRHSLLGWVLRLSWWAIQLVLADAVVLWVVILYLRRKKDRRLEGAIRVLLGDAVAQVQKVGREVKIPNLPKMPQLPGRRNG